MVRDYDLRFGGLRYSAKLICLKQNRDQVWHTDPRGGNAILVKHLCFTKWDKMGHLADLEDLIARLS